jgi:hypothetical protein
MSDAWWDDLPDGSVVLQPDGGTMNKENGSWYIERSEVWPGPPFKFPESVTVIHVPVTDVEPPFGSVVVYQDGLWIRGTVGWRQYWVGNSDTLTWGDFGRHVTRVIRWGLHW